MIHCFVTSVIDIIPYLVDLDDLDAYRFFFPSVWQISMTVLITHALMVDPVLMV